METKLYALIDLRFIINKHIKLKNFKLNRIGCSDNFEGCIMSKTCNKVFSDYQITNLQSRLEEILKQLVISRVIINNLDVEAQLVEAVYDNNKLMSTRILFERSSMTANKHETISKINGYKNEINKLIKEYKKDANYKSNKTVKDENNIKVQIIETAQKLKAELMRKYNNELAGKCIEASDLLVSRYKNQGINAKAIRVYCLYEEFESCSDYCYEEHWLVEVNLNTETIYVDTTIEQFQWAFSKKLPSIYLKNRLPNFYLKDEPSKEVLDKCGWNDWYDYGNYINEFDYWN